MESGSLRSASGSGSGGRSRRGSFDRGVPIGARLAETGTLLGMGGRSRGGVQSASGGGGQLPETVDEVDDSSSPLPVTVEPEEVLKGAPALDIGDPSTKSR